MIAALLAFTLALTFPSAAEPAASVTPVAPVGQTDEANPTWVRTTLVIQVSDVAAAQQALIERAEGAGGWFGSLAEDSVSLRLPVAKEDEVEAYARTLGILVDRNYTRSDLSDSLRDQRSGLAARERTLDRYLRSCARPGPRVHGVAIATPA